MHRTLVAIALALAAPSALVLAQQAPSRPIPLGLVGMRLGTPRTSLPDSTCGTDSTGTEWCRPRLFQRVRIGDSVVVALEVPMHFQAPDSLTADTVWARYVLTRATRTFGTPDSSQVVQGFHTLWWNWDGRTGPRRARVTGRHEPDSAGTLVTTTFHISCSPGVPVAACTAVANP